MLLLFLIILFVTPVFADGLVQCGGPDEDLCTICDIPVVISNLITFVIKDVVFPLALVMVIVGGFMILTAGPSPTRIETGKKILTNTLIGVLIILFSWIIVNFIFLIMTGQGGFNDIRGALMPWNALQSGTCALGGQITTQPISTGGPGSTGNGGTTGGSTPPPPSPPRPPWAPVRRLIGSHVLACSTVDQCTCDGKACVVFPSTIVPLKSSNACAGQSNGYCYISPEMESKLKNLQIGLTQSGAGDQLQVTETWPPTVVHQNICHQEATCVDMNFKPNQAATAPKVSNVISKADASGLRAVYEVKTQTEKNALVGQGVPAGNIQVVSQITGPHFSIYKK